MTLLFDDDERESQGDEDVEEQDSSSEDSGDTSSTQESKDDKDADDSSVSDEEEDDLFDRERAQATIRTLRQKEKERNQFEKELNRLRKDQQKRERKDQSELEQAQSDLKETSDELATLRAENEKYRSRLQRSSFIEQIGFDQKNAIRAWNSLDDAGVEPEFDDKWRLSNKKAVAKALREYDSDLFGAGGGDGGRRSREETEATDMNALIRQGFGR